MSQTTNKQTHRAVGRTVWYKINNLNRQMIGWLLVQKLKVIDFISLIFCSEPGQTSCLRVIPPGSSRDIFLLSQQTKIRITRVISNLDRASTHTHAHTCALVHTHAQNRTDQICDLMCGVELLFKLRSTVPRVW